MLNTFANGSQAGIAKMSVRGRRAGSPVTTLFVCPAVSMPAAASAAGSAGMAPPLARIATRLHTAPTATSAIPGIARLRMTAARTARFDAHVEGRPGVTDRRAERLREERDLEHEAGDRQPGPAQAKLAEAADPAADREPGEQPDRDRVEDEHGPVSPRRLTPSSPSSCSACSSVCAAIKRSTTPRPSSRRASGGRQTRPVVAPERPGRAGSQRVQADGRSASKSSVDGSDRSRSMLPIRRASVAVRPNGTGPAVPGQRSRSSSPSQYREHLGDVGEDLRRSPLPPRARGRIVRPAAMGRPRRPRAGATRQKRARAAAIAVGRSSVDMPESVARRA